MNKDRSKNNKDIGVILTYKPSQEANFRLTKALSMLVNKQSILDFFQKSTKKNDQKIKK